MAIKMTRKIENISKNKKDAPNCVKKMTKG